MAKTRQIVKVFLGSPGDLPDERKCARELVAELNGQWADAFGIQIDLVGWEDTPSAYGRPQETINRELERCEVFIGMMWKKWGTPPDTAGKYSSGFEEEFEISVGRRRSEGKPEISLFLKDIATEFLADPGPDLRKVLAFKDRLIAQKEIYYEQVSDTRDFEKKLRRCLNKYLTDLWQSQNRLQNKEEVAPISDAATEIAPDDGEDKGLGLNLSGVVQCSKWPVPQRSPASFYYRRMLPWANTSTK